MDAGINILPSAKFRRHRVRNLTATTNSARRYNLYGPLCMQSDRLGSDVELSTVRIGDVIGINHAGAYSLSQAWTFIQPMPAVVQVDENEIKLVRRRQTVDDLVALDMS
jgi:diaminopimelate decarboxylase